MAIHEFTPGEPASSAEVNENFQTILSIIGELAEPGHPKVTEITMGPRNNTLITSSSDTGTDDDLEFYQIGWNANFDFTGGEWKFARFLNNRPATALRVGRNGFEVLTTSHTTGNLNSQLEPVFIIKATTGEDRIVIYPTWHIQTINGQAEHVGHYRLTYVPMEDPGILYDNVAVKKNLTVVNATSLGVPSYAKAITISAFGKANNTNDAWMRFYQEKATAARSYKRGLTMFSPLGSGGLSQYGNISGIVTLGFGSYQSKFIVETNTDFVSAFVSVIGYWT